MWTSTSGPKAENSTEIWLPDHVVPLFEVPTESNGNLRNQESENNISNPVPNTTDVVKNTTEHENSSEFRSVDVIFFEREYKINLIGINKKVSS